MKVSSSLKILVVDDCLDTRNYIKTILRKKGFKRVVGAHDGGEAVDILKVSFKEYEPVDLILADWQMPEVDGLSFLAKVRLDDRFKHIPFIMITADRDKEHVVQAINCGVDDYLIKPIKTEMLIRKIIHALQTHEVSSL